MEFLVWIGFIFFILFLLALDIGVFHKKDKAMSAKASLAWTAFWIALAMLFNVFIYFGYEHHWLGLGLHIGHDMGGKEAALNFFAGFLIEKSLSVDNLFVIALIFSYFKVPLRYQHRILFWGILGALVLRGIMIALGAVLVAKFWWINYVFGALLIFTAGKMLMDRGEDVDLEHSFVVKLVKKFYPVSTRPPEGHFFVMEHGKRAVTSLFMALVVIETSDVFFAVDSIPAIFAITSDPFLVFTSNVFAILGLRSLYFSIAVLMEKLRYLKMSLVFLLAFVGVKFILSHHFPIPTWVSLAIIGGILAVGVFASIFGSPSDADE
jgi:tellurite resistance protein TerC